MRPLLLASLLLSAAANAQAPAPRASPAPTRSAPQSEPSSSQPTPPPLVGPGATDAPPPAEPGHTPASPDTALLRGILWATEPAPEEIRVIAIEDLALLGDARALEPLAQLLWDPNPRVQAAAVRSVALFQHPRAEQVLADVVRHPGLPEPLKLQALAGLLYQRTPSARAVLDEAAKSPRNTPTVQSAALAVAARWDLRPTSPESTK